MYEQSHGVPADYALSAAASWYRRAADQGYDAAQGNLGILFATGRGVRRDYVQAYKWFALAGAMANRNFVAERMTGRQIDEAEELVRAWQARPER
jgi:TPR repeat protein